MKTTLKLLGILLTIIFCGLIGFAILWTRQYQQLVSEEPEVVLSPDISNLTYCTMDDVPLQMDLYLPKTNSPWQVLVYVHGGSFTAGDKRTGSGTIDIPAMTERGYAVAAVNYRLMPDHPFPAEVLDAKCAVRYLRAHAEEYSLLTEKIGVWGGSAGGHLAAMLGLTNEDPAFEFGENEEYSSRVDAVVEMFGPMDLTQPMAWLQRLLLRRAFGTDFSGDARLVRASPIQYVNQDSAPFLIIHGKQDTAVPLEQAQLFYDKLLKTGVDATLIIVENANHNFKPTGGPIQPTRAEISDSMSDFFDRVLK
jgi:acetyl esterase/lipase